MVSIINILNVFESNKNGDLGTDLILFIFDEIKKRQWKGISRLQIIKILYLLDKDSVKKNSKKISKYIFTKNKLGPFSNDIVADLENLKNNGFLENVDFYYMYNLIKPVNSDDIVRVKTAIKDFDLELEFNNIIEKAKDVNSLLEYVENLNEVKKASLGEEIRI